jgi:hypothetical protein
VIVLQEVLPKPQDLVLVHLLQCVSFLRETGLLVPVQLSFGFSDELISTVKHRVPATQGGQT